MLRLAQYHLAIARPERQRAQEIAIEAAQTGAERAVPKWNLGLLDRGWKHDIETDHGGAAVEDGRENLPDLSRPGDRRRAGERRRAIGFFIKRHDDGARFRCRMHAFVEPPAQPGENVDR
jgi:hypothetical protein